MFSGHARDPTRKASLPEHLRARGLSVPGIAAALGVSEKNRLQILGWKSMKRQDSSQPFFELSKTLFVVVLTLGMIWCAACVRGYVNPLVAIGSILTFGLVAFASMFVKDRGRFSLRSLLVAVLLVGVEG